MGVPLPGRVLGAERPKPREKAGLGQKVRPCAIISSMNYAPKPVPESITASLARSEAQIAAGQTVPLEPVLDRLRSSIARMQADEQHKPATPKAQLDALIVHYEALGRIEASINLLTALERAKARISTTPEAGLPAPRPYPSLAKAGRRWIIEGTYWISYSLNTPPVISGVFYAMKNGAILDFAVRAEDSANAETFITETDCELGEIRADVSGAMRIPEARGRYDGVILHDFGVFLMGVPAILSALTPEQLQRFRLESIFMPEARRRRNAIYETNPRFVHYTRAEAALSIVENKRLWLRNARSMVDFRELSYGFDLLVSWFNENNGVNRISFFKVFDEIHQDAAREAIKTFDDTWLRHDIGAQTQAYIGCVSEHDPTEDDHGRLSMWRAFGTDAPARVAFVFKVPPLSGAVEFLKCYFSPVSYLSVERVNQIFVEVMENAVTERDFLKSITPAELRDWIFLTLTIAVTCVKHPGFEEEREWRIVYLPGYHAHAGPSLLESEIRAIGGVPQVIYKFPIDARVAPEIAAIDLAAMFDRLILGPSQYSWVMYDAFKSKLEQAGIADAGSLSTDGQDLTPQLDQLKAAGCERVFREKITGATADRPQLKKLLGAVGGGDIVVVTAVDRLSRDTTDLLVIARDLEKAGAGLRSLAEPFLDTTSDFREVVLAILGVAAKLERGRINERTAVGRALAKAQGVKFGPKPKLTPHQCREISERKQRGETVRSIARSYGVMSALTAFGAAIFWFVSAYGKLPPMIAYWDHAPDTDPFYRAVKFSAQMNRIAAAFSGVKSNLCPHFANPKIPRQESGTRATSTVTRHDSPRDVIRNFLPKNRRPSQGGNVVSVNAFVCAALGVLRGGLPPQTEGEAMSILAAVVAALPRRREKVFGQGRLIPLDRNAKVRIMTRARALSRRTIKGKHYGEITAKALAVLEALLWRFHNAKSGLCFPSYETIAEAAGCARSTVAEAIRALEAAGLLSWVNRLKRMRETGLNGWGLLETKTRVMRTSNGYQLHDPEPMKRPDLFDESSKSEITPRTTTQVLPSSIAPLNPELAAIFDRWKAARLIEVPK
eukprot:gene17868-18097_t